MTSVMPLWQKFLQDEEALTNGTDHIDPDQMSSSKEAEPDNIDNLTETDRDEAVSLPYSAQFQR
jgi:hypothetical protein